MAEEFPGSGWWDTPRSRYEPGTASSSSSTSSSGLTSLRGFGWLENVSGGRSSIESVSVSGGGGPMVFLDTPKIQVQGHGSLVLGDSSGGVAMADPNLHMMNLGLSSQPTDWDNQNLIPGDKSETGFRAMLQENLSTNSTPAGPTSHHQIQSGFQIESPSIYGVSPPSSIFQGILGSENQSSAVSYQYSPSYCQNSGELLPAWSKVPQFLRISPSKHQQQAAASSHNQLQFSNNAPFWNATAASSSVSNFRSMSRYFSSPKSSQFSTSSFEEKAKSLPEPGSNVTSAAAATRKKSGSETAGKRSRGGETGTPLPPFKVRKEKMGDRITALQQLVSPFGKTDTASVLTEAIDYIKFLHEQVSILSAPYMKSGGALQHHQLIMMQSMEKCDEPEGPRQGLRSRGLCLVPISSTFPVAHEATVDYWNPTFGGTYR